MLIEAENKYKKNPTLDNLIWYGRRVGYTGDFQRSIDIYTQGLVQFPNSPRILRHRAHRYISLKRYTDAFKDLVNAKSLIKDAKDRIEEDGIPNSQNVPLSTLHFNIYYHLGLVYYFLGDFDTAWIEYSNCLQVSKNDDTVVAASYWLYLIAHQLDKPFKFTLPPNFGKMKIIENFSYYRLLQLFHGLITEEELKSHFDTDIDKATLFYGFAMFYLIHKRVDEAKKILKQNIIENHPSAFGTLASNAELKRLA